jgi:hypothetical protein
MDSALMSWHESQPNQRLAHAPGHNQVSTVHTQYKVRTSPDVMATVFQYFGTHPSLVGPGRTRVRPIREKKFNYKKSTDKRSLKPLLPFMLHRDPSPLWSVISKTLKPCRESRTRDKRIGKRPAPEVTSQTDGTAGKRHVRRRKTLLYVE